MSRYGADGRAQALLAASRKDILPKRMENYKAQLHNRVYYAHAVYGDEETRAVIASLENPWLACGPRVHDFEKRIAAVFGRDKAVAVNSGSSANLLALSALNLPKGSEVVTPACTFPTTVAPIVQLGLKPVFIDSDIGSYTVSLQAVESAITNSTTALMIPQLVGSVNDMRALQLISRRYGLKFVEDCCDTCAPTFAGSPASDFADVTTVSLYGSHIITAMGMGGVVLTDDAKLCEQVTVLRDWGRLGNDTENFDARFDYFLDGIRYDAKFVYSCFGYNLKLNEASAAFAIEQLARLDTFRQRRREVFTALATFFADYEHWFYLPCLLPDVSTTWLAFPLTLRHTAPFSRHEFLKWLEAAGIQTRVLFAGNITRHPACRGVDYRVAGSLDNANYIMASGFLLGCHQGMDGAGVDFLCSTAAAFLDAY